MKVFGEQSAEVDSVRELARSHCAAEDKSHISVVLNGSASPHHVWTEYNQIKKQKKQTNIFAAVAIGLKNEPIELLICPVIHPSVLCHYSLLIYVNEWDQQDKTINIGTFNLYVASDL